MDGSSRSPYDRPPYIHPNPLPTPLALTFLRAPLPPPSPAAATVVDAGVGPSPPPGGDGASAAALSCRAVSVGSWWMRSVKGEGRDGISHAANRFTPQATARGCCPSDGMDGYPIINKRTTGGKVSTASRLMRRLPAAAAAAHALSFDDGAWRGVAWCGWSSQQPACPLRVLCVCTAYI